MYNHLWYWTTTACTMSSLLTSRQVSYALISLYMLAWWCHILTWAFRLLLCWWHSTQLLMTHSVSHSVWQTSHYRFTLDLLRWNIIPAELTCCTSLIHTHIGILWSPFMSHVCPCTWLPGKRIQYAAAQLVINIHKFSRTTSLLCFL